MEDDRWLRPSIQVMMLTMGCIVGGVWLFLAVSTAYAAVWWPDHPILDNSVAEWFRGTAMLSSIFALPFVCGWLWFRSRAWQVGFEGIAVYRGGKRLRSYAWSEITSLHVLPPLEAVARSSRRPFPFGEELPWLTADDAAWLREFARGRLGQRLGSWRRNLDA